MGRRLLIVSILVALCLGITTYIYLGESPEVKRDRYFQKGQEYIVQSKLSEALIMFKNALKVDPTFAEAHYQIGLVLLQKRDFQQALAEFGRAIDRKPEMTKARYQIGTLYALGQDIPRAKEQLAKMREQEQNSLQVRYLAATIAVAEKDPDRALKELQEALVQGKKENSHDIARMYVEVGAVQAIKKDLSAAEISYRKALEIESGFLAARVALTKLYVVAGNEAKAEEELTVATKADPENEALLHILGDLYSRTRRYDDYEKLYRELLQKKPSSIIAKKKMIEILIVKGNLQQAKAYTDELLNGQPHDTDGYYFRGQLYLAEKNYDKASDDLSAVTTKAPTFAPGFYHLAMAQSGLNQMRQARGSLLKATELRPSWPLPRLTLAEIYLTSGDVELAWQESERILKMSPENRSALLIGGAAQLRRGEPEKALALFKKAQSLDPKDPAPYINIGAVYVAQKNYPRALKEYEEALKLDADRVDALGSIAGIHILQGNRKAAFERVQQHLAKTKKQPEIYQLLGQLNLQGKEYAKAIEHFDKAVQLNPDLLSVYFLLGNAYSAQRSFDRAIEEYQTIIRKNPLAVPPHMLLGVLYDLKQQPAKANEYYKKVLDLNRDFFPAANNLAWNYAEHDANLDSALALAQKARELSPENPHIADTLGWIYYKKGAYASAISLLKESTEQLQNKHSTVLYHLGMAQYRGGDKALARENLKRALAISQAFPGAEEAKKILSEVENKKPS
jgi:tetratricopeptide (TPR) repeat protein